MGIKFSDIPCYKNIEKAYGMNIKHINDYELSFALRNSRYIILNFINSVKTSVLGKISIKITIDIDDTVNRELPFVSPAELKNFKLRLGLYESINNFLMNEDLFESFISKDIECCLTPFSYDKFYVKNPSTKISNKIKMNTGITYNNYQKKIPCFILSIDNSHIMSVPLTYDIGKFLKYYSNKELLVDAARYREKIEYHQNYYNKKINELEAEIANLKKEQSLLPSDEDLEIIDRHILENFDEGDFTAKKLISILKKGF